jgi:hypothetical protein
VIPISDIFDIEALGMALAYPTRSNQLTRMKRTLITGKPQRQRHQLAGSPAEPAVWISRRAPAKP